MKILKIGLDSLYAPLKTFQELSYSRKSIALGWWFTLGFAALYSLTSLLLHLKGFTPLAPPSIPIADNDYYFYQTFFTIPVGVLGVGLNYGIVAGLLKVFGISVKQQYLWGILSVASVLPSFFTMWLIETGIVALFYSANEWTYLTFDLIRIAVGTIWTVILTILAVRSIEKVNWWQSILIGTLASGAMGTLMGICYR